jgi:hydroxymethylglutaryl-CoA lyase
MKNHVTYPSFVKIVDVGPRDGLQNQPEKVSLEAKVQLVDMLSDSGLTAIEAGAFVSPKWVPQMADTAEVMARIKRKAGVSYPVLAPNLKGYEAAVAAKCEEVAIFGAASETFSQKNINCSIAKSLERFSPIVERAHQDGVKVRGYISCVLGCPYEGDVAPSAVAHVAKTLFDMGCYEVSLGDTIGTGTPTKAVALIDAVTEHVPVEKLAAHFHDTYGQALANLLAVMEKGVAVIDTAVAGLGGCPYAKGASGNVATEDVLYMLNGMEIETGIDLDKILAASRSISDAINKPPASKVGLAMMGRTAAE